MNRAAGRKQPTPDRLGRDFLYGASIEQKLERTVALPATVDLRKNAPFPIEDQGTTFGCGGFAGAALLNHLYPRDAEALGGFSAMALYHAARELDGDALRDSGVQIRTLMKAMQKVGAQGARDYPFDPDKIFSKPPQIAVPWTVGSYAMLTGSREMLECLAQGFPFVLGFLMPRSLDANETSQHGIMQLPDLQNDELVGGHIVLAVGYVTGFRTSPLLERTGIEPSRVDDTMLLIRNSWGSKWSPNYRGHFWMPLSYAANPTTGADAWTARVTEKVMPASAPIAAAAPRRATQRQLDACFRSIRNALDTQTSYGAFVSDTTLRPFTDAAAVATIEAGD